jgi:hypothetical protein
MTELEDYIQSYLQELESHLSHLSPVHRKNQVEEVKGHLVSFIVDYQQKGLTGPEIEQKIREKFLSPEEVADQLKNSSEFSSKTNNKHTFIITAVLALTASFILPDYKNVPLAVLLFILAYYIYSKKILWGFAMVRKNPGQVKNRDKIARLGAIYVAIVGLVIFMGEFIEALNLEVTFWVLIIGYVAYTGYIRKNTVE